MTAVPDIPRLYTALAECLATLLYARQLTPRYSARRSTVNSLIWMAGLAVFMQLTGSVPLVLWLPCMVAAIGSMYLFLWRTCETTPLEAGYYCARAFILAELAASVEWQLHCALWPQRTGRDPLAVLLLVLVDGKASQHPARQAAHYAAGHVNGGHHGHHGFCGKQSEFCK